MVTTNLSLFLKYAMKSRAYIYVADNCLAAARDGRLFFYHDKKIVGEGVVTALNAKILREYAKETSVVEIRATRQSLEVVVEYKTDDGWASKTISLPSINAPELRGETDLSRYREPKARLSSFFGVQRWSDPELMHWFKVVYEERQGRFRPAEPGDAIVYPGVLVCEALSLHPKEIPVHALVNEQNDLVLTAYDLYYVIRPSGPV